MKATKCWFCMALATVSICGCGEIEPPKRNVTGDFAGLNLPADREAQKKEQAKGTGQATPPSQPAQAAPPSAAYAQPPAQEPVRQTASADVTVTKGTGYGRGPITTPLQVYFRIPDRLVFNIQIPDAMNKFKAINGRGPKSHEEFMEQIIKANLIPLPDLQGADKYVFDPQQQELMIEQNR